MFNVSTTQFLRAFDYINQYNQANSMLSQVGMQLRTNLQGILDFTAVEAFLKLIQDNLNANVQRLTVRYSPENIRAYIFGFYQTFLNNLLLNNGTQADVLAMNQKYYEKILSPNATVCFTLYNQLYNEIYSKAASNFTSAMESEVSSVVTRLEALRMEIVSMVKNLVRNVEEIISTRATASIMFNSFVKKRNYLVMNCEAIKIVVSDCY